MYSTMDSVHIINHLKQGAILAYPTESVFGLGVDPWNQCAVQALMHLKQRDDHKGFIIIAAHYEQLLDLIMPLSTTEQALLLRDYQGYSCSWVVPAHPHCPQYLCGASTQLAVRITRHPIAKMICHHAGALISTSANPQGLPPARTMKSVEDYFPNASILCVEGTVGTLKRPTPILALKTGKVIRA